MKNISDVVVDRLCKYMGEQDLTQYKLASLSGLPYATVKSIMQKRTKSIDFKTIILLASGLGIKPSEFVDTDAFLAENLNLE